MRMPTRSPLQAGSGRRSSTSPRPGVIALAIALLLFSCGAWLIQMLFSASIGSESRFNRMGLAGPVVVFIVVYVVLQVLLFVSILVVPLGIILSLVLVTGYCLWRTVRSWNRKVSLV